jgi:D-alanine-D-alanine ligase
MKVGLTYNLGTDYQPKEDDPPDAAAEFDTPATIDGLLDAIRANGHEPVPIGDGMKLFRWLATNSVDIVFNIAEGYYGRGREAQIPAMLELLQVPYVGSDSVTLGVALDKVISKQIMKAEGIPTAPFLKVSRIDELNSVPLKYPLFAKPNHEGTGKGIDADSKIKTYPKLKSRIRYLLKTYHEPVLIEEYLEGDEFTVGIVGNPPHVIGTMQIIFDTNEVEDFYSYHVKEEYEKYVHYVCPPKIDPDRLDQIEEIAVRAYKVLECKDFGRVDVRCDSDGNPYFLEINPLAGLNPLHSDLCIIARHNDITYEQLIGRILYSAMARHRLI